MNSLVPIIVITADAMETTRDRVFKLGANDLMTKPVDQKILYEEIPLYYLKRPIRF